MNPYMLRSNDLAAYYWIYLSACAVLILALSRVLHNAGRVFLNDAFAGNTLLARTVSRLLDIGFYLVSTGYVALTYQTNWPMVDLAMAIKIAITKIGGLLLILGIAHIFNLLLLALFRQRRALAVAPPPEVETCHAK
jgi:hypothetical protein